MNPASHIILRKKKWNNPGSGSGGEVPIPATIFTSRSGVDGTFLATITFGSEVPDLEASDVLVTNGSCDFVYTVDNLVWWVSIVPDGVDDVIVALNSSVGTATPIEVTINSAWGYLIHNANFWFYMREMVGDENVDVRPEDPGEIDLTGNITLNDVGSGPRTRNYSEAGNGVCGFQCDNSRGYSISAATANTLFTSSFILDVLISGADGRPATTAWWFGNNDAVNTGFKVGVTTGGLLFINYSTLTWQSTSAVFANGATAVSHFQIQFDFTGDTITVYKDNVAVPGSITAGSMTGIELTYACTADWNIGNNNNNGTVQNATARWSLYSLARTPISAPASSIRTYIPLRKPIVEYISTIVDDAFKNPHAVRAYTKLATSAHVSGKGSPNAATEDGSLGHIGYSNPASPNVIDGYYGNADQLNAETVYIVDGFPNRVLNFFEDGVHLFGVDGTGQYTLLDTVVTEGQVVNGAVQIGEYVFGADKGARIQVIDVSNVTGSGSDSISLFGQYLVSNDGVLSAHDIAKFPDNKHIIGIDIDAGHDVFIYQVFDDNGDILPVANWVAKGTINDVSLDGANRIQHVRDSIFTVHGNATNYCAKIDASDVDAPVIVGYYDQLTKSSSGARSFKDKYMISGGGNTLFMYDITSQTDVKFIGGYSNTVTFANGPIGSHHDMEWFIYNYECYTCVPYQNENRLVFFRLNRI